jgi:hypothetical protein
MKKIRTVAYLGSGYLRRYFTFYQDLLDSFYYSFCDIEIKTGECICRGSIHGCSKCLVESFVHTTRYYVCETHYVDAAGNLRSVVPE